MRLPTLFLILLLPLAACDQVNQTLGVEDMAKKEARLDAEGRAVGGGCRQSGRAIEDCYSIYSWLPKASIYAGWRDMDTYMRENKIDTVEPQLPPAEPPGAKKRKKAAEDEEAESETKASKPAADKPGEKAADKPAEKAAEKPAAEAAKGAGKH